MAVETKEYRASARYQHVSPQKARLVLDLIKGRGVQEALETAAFAKKRIAPVIHKLLVSAVDNAKYVAGEQGIDLDVDNLYVKQAVADDGPRMKRIRPAPLGRAYRYQRRLTHITLAVAERNGGSQNLVTTVEESEAAKPAKKTAAKKTAAKKAAAPAAEKKSAAKKSAPKKTAAKKAAKKKAE
jgi:large subunit ribosomal protein L22